MYKRRYHIGINLLFCINFVFCPTFLFAQQNPNEFFEDMHIWLLEHPEPSQAELMEYAEREIAQLTHIDNVYNFLYSIIEFYHPHLIPAEFYQLFARIASMKYDFTNAAILYYSAFEKSNQPELLLAASIQEYHAGNRELAERNLQMLEDTFDTSQLGMPYILLKTQLAATNQNPAAALTYLDSLVKRDPSHAFPPEFYFMLYRISQQNNNEDYSNYAAERLQTLHPTSIELHLITTGSIHTIPLPATLLSFFDEQINLSDTASSESIASSVEDFRLGYQVAAFQNRQSAHIFYRKFLKRVADLNLEIQMPVLRKATIEETEFYQIVIPLRYDKDTNIQIAELREKGIEGFLKEHDQ